MPTTSAPAAAPRAHVTVLLHEAVDALLHAEADLDGTYLDGTFGRGGHSRLLLSRLGPQGRLIALDRDPEAIAAARAIEDPRFEIRHARFGELGAGRRAAGPGRQLAADRQPRAGLSASASTRRWTCAWTRPVAKPPRTFLARADERQIAEVIRDYGEERFAGPIAKALVARRDGGHPLFEPQRELAALVARVVKTREPGQDPATRTFQALRIHVNAELEELEQG
jgi:16S rRNA (cytosine1402-N4)-methyltransferase